MLDEKIQPMLAHSSEPFDSPRHVFEIKWDGTRCLLFARSKEVRLQNRRGTDITSRYPELLSIHKATKAKDVILDGELVVLSGGKPAFNRLQQREHLSDPLKVDLLAKNMPATYVVFDLLFLNGKNHTTVPLIQRKETLRGILRESPHLLMSECVEEQGKAFFDEAMRHGLEGVMAKSIDSPYLMGKRSRHWLKIKQKHTAICYIVGYTEGRGARDKGFGSLAVTTVEEGQWMYRGRVGSGFSQTDIVEISSTLKALEVNSPPLPGLKVIKSIQWVRPELRCEVTFHEKTSRGHFRAPVFKRLLE
jgi:DNA ligase D-like protein (predicted ligase)